MDPRPGAGAGVANPSRGGLGTGAKDQEPAARRHERPQLGEGEDQGSKGHVARSGSVILVVANPQDLHVGAAHGPGRFPKKCPAPPSRLEEHRFLGRPEEGENEAGGTASRTHVEETSRVEEWNGRENCPDEHVDARLGSARPGQVDPPAPDSEQIQICSQGLGHPRVDAERLEVGSMGTGAQPWVRPAGATVTRRFAPSPTL
jgi:hypothetical protein